MVTRKRFEQIVRALPEVTSAPHFDRVAFRVPRRIFTTLANDGREANVRLDPLAQEAAIAARPEAFAAVKGAWGAAGWTRCDLAQVDEADLARALRDAHALAREPPPAVKKRAVAAAKKAPRRAR